jgi:hypothetical protein
VETRSPQQRGPEFFTAPDQVNRRRYEALRAHYVDGLTFAVAGARFGYTRWAMINLDREFRAGTLELFAPPGKPGPKSAPRKDAARARVIALRRRGLPVYEISAALAAEGIMLHRASVGQILAEEGFGRLSRRHEERASINPATTGRDTRLPRAGVIDFAALPDRADTQLAGLLLVIPTWSPSTCPPWSGRPAIPAQPPSLPSAGCCPCCPSSSPPPAASPTSTTCCWTSAAPCSPDCRSCRRSPLSPTTPTGWTTTTSADS